MKIITHNLGFPRIGLRRELKKALESYWAGRSTSEELLEAGRQIRQQNWLLQKKAGIDLIPSNDFSFYDQVLDTCAMVGAIPPHAHLFSECFSVFEIAESVLSQGLARFRILSLTGLSFTENRSLVNSYPVFRVSPFFS